MDRGFYHPERGYWQTGSAVPESILTGYPEGTAEVTVKPGADYDLQDGVWVQLPPDIVVVRASAHAQMIAWIERFTSPLTSKYPGAEQALWPLKLPAAQRIVDGVPLALDVAIFADEVTLSGRSAMECATATLWRGQMFMRVASSISGLRQSTEAAIEQATTAAEVSQAIEFAKATAEQLATALGLPIPQPTGV